MFKRTEEQEWTRFSKALSNRESEETSDAESAEGAEEIKSQESTPSAPASPSTPAAPAPPPIQRPVNNDVNVSVSRIAQPSSRASFGGSDVQSVIGPQTSFSGTLRSETAVRILGAVDGEIISSQSVAVEESARVKARITAETITVAGEVNGEIQCAGRVEILPSGRVHGEIQA
ncbi:MAG TPA: polymer-forming cytoskeletal protein, partial [Chloroflexota bacterium]|nr:polymer-forming cytoskeletal protein [Chloroflexota bacterium]